MSKENENTYLAGFLLKNSGKELRKTYSPHSIPGIQNFLKHYFIFPPNYSGNSVSSTRFANLSLSTCVEKKILWLLKDENILPSLIIMKLF